MIQIALRDRGGISAATEAASERDRRRVEVSVEQRQRIDTMIATSTGPNAYRFDIRLQGEGETVFLDL